MGIDYLSGYPSQWLVSWIGFALLLVAAFVVVYVVRREVMYRYRDIGEDVYVQGFRYFSFGVLVLLGVIGFGLVQAFLGHLASWIYLSSRYDGVLFAVNSCLNVYGGEEVVVNGVFDVLYCRLPNGSVVEVAS